MDSQEPGKASRPAAGNVRATELFDFLLEHIPDRIYFKDTESRFLRVSRAMAQFFGATDPGEVNGKTDFDFFTEEHARAAFNDEQELMRSGRAITGKVEKETLPGGRIGWALTAKMPLRNSLGEIIGTCGISKDISEMKEMEDALARSNTALSERQAELEQTLVRLKQTLDALKAAQEQLVEAEKAQSVARLAAGVAHEVRNPLNILNAGLEYLASEPAISGDATAGVIVQDMREAIQRADAVVCALMDSSRPANLNLQDTDLNALLRTLLASHNDDITRRGIVTSTDLFDNLPTLKLDQSKIEMVAMGVIGNAMDAIGSKGGRMHIRTGLQEVALSDLERNPGGRDGQRFRNCGTYVSLEIEDTGPGIPQKALQQIFDPFFTTKEAGSGTGMGLTVSRKIIELHGGTMQIGNREEGGARVTILLKAIPR